MALSLTTTDLDGLRGAMRLLLSPLDFPTTDAWRGEANRALKPVLGADLVTFYLPGVDAEPLYSEDVDVAMLRPYPSYERRMDERFRVGRRMAELGVWTRQLVYARDYERILRTAYWNDYIVPVRAFDALGMTVRMPSMPRPGTLFFHHERPTGRKFGRRGYDLLRIAFPAFEAGVRMHTRLSRRRAELARTLDVLPDPLMLARADGTVCHRNRALGRLLAADPEAERVWEEALRAARAVAETAGLNGRRTDPAGAPSMSRTVRTQRAEYRLVGVLADASLVDRGPTVLVSVTPSRPALPSAAAIRERHGLTPRQAEVALLVARRRTNKEVARALDISPHTVRHHLEHIMRALGVHSRREIERAVLAASH